MGIQDLKKLIREQNKEAIDFSVPLSTFSGSSIAVDSAIIIWANMAIITKSFFTSISDPSSDIDPLFIEEGMRRQIGAFCTRLRQENITPIFIFDGPSRDVKKATVTQREEKRETHRDKIEKVLEEKREEEEKPSYVVDIIKIATRDTNLRELKKRDVKITRDVIEITKSIVRELGYEIIQAPHDGEATCASLVISGRASAVWSTDSDTLAYGAQWTITGPDKINPSNVLCMNLERSLTALGLGLTSFRDLCILLGCDYNTRMKGYGPKKCFALIKDHGTIDKIREAKPSLPFEQLNHEVCREIFEGKS